MWSAFRAPANNCIILHRWEKPYQDVTDLRFNYESTLKSCMTRLDFINWHETTTKLSVKRDEGFTDMLWRWSRKSSLTMPKNSPFGQHPSQALHLMQVLQEDLFLKATPLSAFLCSQPALMDACTGMVNYMSLGPHFKSGFPHLFEDPFCKWELGGHMQSANCLFSARRE